MLRIVKRDDDVTASSLVNRHCRPIVSTDHIHAGVI